MRAAHHAHRAGNAADRDPRPARAAARQFDLEVPGAADPERPVPVARRAADPLRAEDDPRARLLRDRRRRAVSVGREGRYPAAPVELGPAVRVQALPGEEPLARWEEPGVERDVADAEAAQQLPVAGGS